MIVGKLYDSFYSQEKTKWPSSNIVLIYISQKHSEVSHGRCHLFETGSLYVIFESVILVKASEVPGKI